MPFLWYYEYVQSFIFNYLGTSLYVAYGFLFLGVLFEGDVTLLAGAFLANQGFLNIFIVLALSYVATMIADTLWFFFGRWFFTGSSSLTRTIEKFALPFDNAFARRPFRTLFLSKFAYGIHRPLLARMHSAGFSFKQFFKMDLIANVGWLFVISGIGYFLGSSYELFKPYFHFGEIILLIGIVLFVYMERRVIKGVKRKGLRAV